jgi:hypothetical protein
VIDGNKEVLRAEKGKSFQPSIDGWFVPDARMKEIMDELNEKIHDLEKKK